MSADLLLLGRYPNAEAKAKNVAKAANHELGQEHSDTLASLGKLATAYSNQGRWEEAEKLRIQEMEASRRVLGQEHPHTLISMDNLATTYRNQERWKEAEKLHVQVMEAKEGAQQRVKWKR